MIDPIHPQIFPHGFRYEVHTRVTETDLYLWAGLTGDSASIRRASAFTHQTSGGRSVVQDAYLTSLIVAVVARLIAHLPAPGALLVAMTVQFAAPVFVGTALVVVVTAHEWDAVASLYWLDIRAIRADGTPAITGQVGLRPHANQLAAA